jgi:hypothetical protein
VFLGFISTTVIYHTTHLNVRAQVAKVNLHHAVKFSLTVHPFLAMPDGNVSMAYIPLKIKLQW